MQDEALHQRIEDVLARLRALRRGTTAPGDTTSTPERVLEELAATLEELQIAYEELHSQNEELSATQALLDRERSRLQELFEYAPDGYLVTDDEGMISAANRSAAMLLHVPQQRLVGKPLIVFIVEGDRQAFHSRLSQVRNGHHIRNWRVRLQPRYDTPIVTAVAATPADKSTQAHVRWLFRDITEQARAEEMTRKHRERLSGILNSAMDAIISINEYQRITLFNPAAERLFQYDAAQVLGRPLDILLPEGFRERHGEHIHNFGQTGVTSRSMGALGVVHGRRADGEEFPIEASISQIMSDGEKFYTVILRDITERIETERRLRRRTQELEALARVSAALRQAETSEELAPLLVAQSVDAMDADAGTIVFDQHDGFVSLSLNGSDCADALCRREHPPGSIPLWHTLPPDDPLFVTHVSEQDELGRCDAWQTALADMAAGAAVALHGETDPIAVLMLGYREREEFVSHEVRLLSAIADMASNAFQRANLTNTLERRVAARTRELSTLYDVTALTSQSLDLDTVLERALEGVLAAVQADIGAIHLLDETDSRLRLAYQVGLSPDIVHEIEQLSPENRVATSVLRSDKVIVIPDMTSDPRIPEFARTDRSYVGMPMHAGGRAIGVLSVIGPKQYQFNAEEVALVATIADQIAVAVENAHLHQQAKQVAISRERQRMARELHDSVTQHLYGLRLYADTVQEQAKAGDLDSVQATLSQLNEILQDTFAEMRLLVHELRPSALEQHTLADALRDRLNFVEKRVGLQTDVQVAGLDDLAPSLEQLLYRVALEALTNVIKHAGARAVTVRVLAAGDEVMLQVEDDGVGFDDASEQQTGGMGLSGMRGRVQDAGGTLEIETSPGAGTTITARVPRAERTR